MTMTRGAPCQRPDMKPAALWRAFTLMISRWAGDADASGLRGSGALHQVHCIPSMIRGVEGKKEPGKTKRKIIPGG